MLVRAKLVPLGVEIRALLVRPGSRADFAQTSTKAQTSTQHFNRKKSSIISHKCQVQARLRRLAFAASSASAIADAEVIT